MSLQNFGSILNFAAELESADQAFYLAAAANPACAEFKGMFEEFAADEKKNEKTILRVRRENVTEMILEPIYDFTKEPFVTDREGAETMSLEQVLSRALEIEDKARRFYTQAAEKINALPEVSRALARTAKRREAHKKRLQSLSSK
jgi:rubrerythrin